MYRMKRILHKAFSRFTSKSFTFTLSQLHHQDLQPTKKKRTIIIPLVFPMISFLFGIPNNLFSFVTFKRSQCLRNGLSHPLFCLSIVNQISLGLVLVRIVHLVANTIERLYMTMMVNGHHTSHLHSASLRRGTGFGLPKSGEQLGSVFAHRFVLYGIGTTMDELSSLHHPSLF